MRVIVVALALAAVAVPSTVLAQNAQTVVTPAQQKVDAALRVLNLVTAQYRAGSATIDDVAAWASRWFHARRDTLSGPGAIVAAQEWVDKMRALEQIATQHVQAGMATSADAAKAEFYRLEAEMTLAKLKTP